MPAGGERLRHARAHRFIVPPAVSQVSGTRDAVLDGKPGIVFPAEHDETYHTALSAGLSHIQGVSAYWENSPSSLAVSVAGRIYWWQSSLGSPTESDDAS